MYRLILILFYVVIFVQPLSAHAGKSTFPAGSTGGSSRNGEIDKPYLIKEFLVSGEGILKVFTAGGNIEVYQSSEEERVKVELYVDRGFAFWSNANNLDNFRITVLQRKNEIVASVERKKSDTGFFSDRINFSFRVYVPESFSSELKTLGGNISMEEIKGRQILKTGGGNIRLTDMNGHLQAFTAGGNISIRDSQGKIFMQTQGGNIQVDRSRGELRLKTHGGRIVTERISGTMLAQVGGGDIRADFTKVGAGINLQTAAGNIQLEVPDQSGYELFLDGTEVIFDEKGKVSGEVGAGWIKGRYGDSGPPIELHTNAGTITLKIK